MVLKLSKLSAIAIALLMGHATLAQDEEPVIRRKIPVRSLSIHKTESEKNLLLLTENGLPESAPACGVDTILYPYLKELVKSAPNDSFLIDAMVGNVRTASQAYRLNASVKIKGVQFWGGAYSTSTAHQTLNARAYLYEIDAYNRPVKALDSADVTINEQYDYYEAVFPNPHTYASNFAVGVRSVINDTLAVITNNAGNQWSVPAYGENLAWRRFGSGAWNSTLSFFGQDMEFMIFPIVEYQPTLDFNIITEQTCVGNSINFQNTSSALYGDTMFNLEVFNTVWGEDKDSTFIWEFGDGTKSSGKNATHIYTTPGTYTVTLKGTMFGYYTECSNVITKEVVVSSGVQISKQPVTAKACDGSEASFMVAAEGTDLLYQWQQETTEGFKDVDENIYSGAKTKEMTVVATTTLDDLRYRVKILGTCAADEIISDTVTLSIKIPAQIGTEPQSQSVCPKASTTIGVTASGADPVYQWQTIVEGIFVNLENGTTYEGVKAGVLSINEGHDLSENTYRVIVSNDCAKDTSAIITFTAIDDEKPEFTDGPEDITITSAKYDYTIPTATDNCSDVTVELKNGLESGADFPIGKTIVTYEAIDESGNKAEYSFNVTYDEVTGVRESMSLLEAMYPNPASDFVNISLKNTTSKVTVEIVNTSGQIVRKSDFENSNNVGMDISTLPKGIYFVNVLTGNGKQTTKLVVN